MNFDSVDIGGRSSISVRELRSKIILQKNLNFCQDFDLVFSDAASGQGYDDDNFQIPSGSSVIIKRVPARTEVSTMMPINAVGDITPINAVGNIGVKTSFPPTRAVDQMDEFDDFGADVSPVPDAILTNSDLESSENKCGNAAMANLTGLRLGCPKRESGDQAIRTGYHFIENKGNIDEEQRVEEERVEERKKLEKLLDPKSTVVPNMELPPELKCSLCNAYFEHAVMIPCCQHSFCDKCIRQELVKKSRCPKCFSDKCKAEDLLPNLSLRQAIEHFLESQMLMTASEKALDKYVPDGESGIHGKDASCAVTVIQREPELPHSPSATGKGSNQVIAESFYDSNMRRNSSYGPRFSNLAAGRQSAAYIKHKGNRTCYMCGSPDHLIRDCPASSCQHTMLHTGPGIVHGGIPGYASAYWNGAAYPPPIRPFSNMYSNPHMMTFNASLVPMSPYVVPPYVPSVYGGLPTPGGIMGTGNMVRPIGNTAEHPLDHCDYKGHQYSDTKRKLSNENLGRGRDFGDVDGGYREPERSHDYRVRKEREVSGSHSEDSFARRSRKKTQIGKFGDSDTYSADGRHEKSSRSSVAGRDQKPYPSERSSQGIEHMHSSSSKHSEDKYNHHKRSSRKHHDGREQSNSDHSWGHRHQSGKADDVRLRDDSRVRDSHKKHNHTEFGLEPSSPGGRRRQYKDRDFGLESRHTRHSTKHKNEDLCDDRWQMVCGSDEDCRDDYSHHKRKRVH